MPLSARRVTTTLVELLMIGILVIELFPVLWVAINSLKTSADVFHWPPTLIPHPVTLDNYRYVFRDMGVAVFLRNSVAVAVVSTLLCCVAGAPGAYAITRFRTGGRALSVWILMQLMIPSVALIVPLFVLFSRTRLLDTWVGLAISHVSFNLPLAVWLMMGFFAEVPAELEEAGRVDGCTRFQAFSMISLPLVLAGLAATAIFIAIQSWNEFLFAVVLTSSARAQTLPVIISTLIHPVTDMLYGPMCAAAVIALVPVFIFSLTVQKYLIRGVTAGALKA